MNALLRHVSVVPFTASVGLSCRAEIARPGQAYAGTWVMTLGRGNYAEPYNQQLISDALRTELGVPTQAS